MRVLRIGVKVSDLPLPGIWRCIFVNCGNWKRNVIILQGSCERVAGEDTYSSYNALSRLV